MVNNIDEIKDAIMEYMNEESIRFPHIWHSAGTIGVRVSNISGFNSKEVERAVNFLGEEGYLAKHTKDHEVSYRISSKGANKFTPSKYSQSFSHITINQSGGISIVGAGNNIGTINQTTISAISELDKLIKLLNESNLAENNKRDAILDTEAIKNQLAKTEPDKSFINKSWGKILETARFANNAVELLRALSILFPLIKTFVPELQVVPEHGNVIA